MLRHFRLSRAFTLVELLVVIVILGILIAIAVPSFVGSRDKARDAQAQSSVVVAAHNAKAAWVDEESYKDADYIGQYLGTAEPGLSIKTTSTFSGEGPETIFVDVPASDGGATVVLCAQSRTNLWFCLTENANGDLLTAAAGAVDQPLLAANVAVARSWGESLASARCWLPTASTPPGTNCTDGGAGWGSASGSGESAESQSEPAPVVQISTGPPAETSLTSAPFTWTTSAGGAVTSTECKVDGGNYEPCASPLTLTEVGYGPHTLFVRVSGPGGSSDASHPWSVIAPDPIVTITAQPPAETSLTSAPFDWNASTGGPVTSIECEIDGGGFAPCSAPLTITDLALGPHTFTVQVTGPSGGVDSASKSWTIYGPPTVTINGPTQNPGVYGTFASIFSWVAGGSPVTLTECRVDGAAFAACPDGEKIYSSTALAAGSHTFDVRVSGPGGTGSDSVTWTINAAPLPVGSPSLTGSAAVGQTLNISGVSFSGTPAPTITYQWQRKTTGWADIPGATSATYAVVAGDTGAQLRVNITASNPAGTNQVTAGPSSAVTDDVTYPARILSQSPIAYWRLNETSGTSVADSSGNGRTASVGAGVSLGQPGIRPMSASGSAYFGGSGQITYNGTAGLGANNVVLEAWVNIASLPTKGTFVHVGGYGTGYAMGIGGTYFDNDGTRFLALFESVRWIDSGYSFPAAPGKYHVAIKITPTNEIIFYVNGQVVGINSGGAAANAPTGTINIGGYYGVRGFTGGRVQDVAIYSGNPADSVLAANYQASQH